MSDFLYQGWGCNHDAYAGHCPYCHIDLPSVHDRKLDLDLKDIADQTRKKMFFAISRRKKIRVKRKRP